MRSVIDIMGLYGIKGLTASANYSKEYIGFYKPPKLAFITSALIHFSSLPAVIQAHCSLLMTSAYGNLEDWQGDGHAG